MVLFLLSVFCSVMFQVAVNYVFEYLYSVFVCVYSVLVFLYSAFVFLYSFFVFLYSVFVFLYSLFQFCFKASVAVVPAASGRAQPPALGPCNNIID